MYREVSARNIRDGLSNAFRGGQGAIVDARMAAGRRVLAQAYPAVQVHQRRSQHWAVVYPVEGLLSPSAVALVPVGGRESARCVLGPGVVVNPDRL